MHNVLKGRYIIEYADGAINKEHAFSLFSGRKIWKKH